LCGQAGEGEFAVGGTVAAAAGEVVTDIMREEVVEFGVEAKYGDVVFRCLILRVHAHKLLRLMVGEWPQQ
jgi:hypothetical protein